MDAKFTQMWLESSESRVDKTGIYKGNLNALIEDINRIMFVLNEHNRLWVEMGKAGRDYEDVDERINSLFLNKSTRSVKEMLGVFERKLEKTQRHYQSFLNPDEE